MSWFDSISPHETLVRGIPVHERNKGAYPSIKVDIIFDADGREIERFLCDKEREAVPVFGPLDIFRASFCETVRVTPADTEQAGQDRDDASCGPKVSGSGDDKEIDIRVLICFPHSSGIAQRYHQDLWEQDERSGKVIRGRHGHSIAILRASERLLF